MQFFCSTKRGQEVKSEMWGRELFVQAVHIPYVGRRKTWIVGLQYATAAVMLVMLPLAGSVTSDDDMPLSSGGAMLLALSFGVLSLLATFHEVATDGWGKHYIHYKYTP